MIMYMEAEDLFLIFFNGSGSIENHYTTKTVNVLWSGKGKSDWILLVCKWPAGPCPSKLYVPKRPISIAHSLCRIGKYFLDTQYSVRIELFVFLCLGSVWMAEVEVTLLLFAKAKEIIGQPELAVR